MELERENGSLICCCSCCDGEFGVFVAWLLVVLDGQILGPCDVSLPLLVPSLLRNETNTERLYFSTQPILHTAMHSALRSGCSGFERDAHFRVR